MTPSLIESDLIDLLNNEVPQAFILLVILLGSFPNIAGADILCSERAVPVETPQGVVCVCKAL